MIKMNLVICIIGFTMINSSLAQYSGGRPDESETEVLPGGRPAPSLTIDDAPSFSPDPEPVHVVTTKRPVTTTRPIPTRNPEVFKPVRPVQTAKPLPEPEVYEPLIPDEDEQQIDSAGQLPPIRHQFQPIPEYVRQVVYERPVYIQSPCVPAFQPVASVSRQPYRRIPPPRREYGHNVVYEKPVVPKRPVTHSPVTPFENEDEVLPGGRPAPRPRPGYGR